jgi:hypothetical protein
VPFLRVVRDKRGYETTYLMHWFREGSRQYSRILYMFRTPGGVRVGRMALEPQVLRQIEVDYPDIEFDWGGVLEHRQVVEPPPERRPRKRRRGEDEAPGEPAASAPAPAPAARAPQPAARPRLVVPAVIEGDTLDAQVAFLAHWHGVLRAHIEERVEEPSRREALLALTERLNPAAWTDADQITAGLQQAVEALERLSHVFARRRRRSRKPSRAQAPEGDESGITAPDDPAGDVPGEPTEPADG